MQGALSHKIQVKLSPFEIFLSFYTLFIIMRQRKRSILFLSMLVLFLVVPLTQTVAYDDNYGVEYDDLIDISFRVYYNGSIKNDYPPESPFQMRVNPTLIAEVYLNFILGMKIGENRPYVSWTTQGEEGPVFVEYVNNTLIRVVEDSTPPGFSGTWKVIRGILYAGLVIGVISGSIYLYVKLRPKLSSRGCINCSSRAYLKCAKCGSFTCQNCSGKGCTSCGSTKFIRVT